MRYIPKENSMPIFSLLIVLLLPKPRGFSPNWNLAENLPQMSENFLLREYRAMYNECNKTVVAWHKVELEKLDFDFRLLQAKLRLVMAREKAHHQGIGPLDPKYPDI